MKSIYPNPCAKVRWFKDNLESYFPYNNYRVKHIRVKENSGVQLLLPYLAVFVLNLIGFDLVWVRCDINVFDIDMQVSNA
jgi:hypothetical protein